MVLSVDLPDLGEGIVEAEVEKWLVKPGDEVAEEQPLVEVMTDKATVTIPAPRRGRVAALRCAEGEVVRVGAPLLELEVAGEGAQAAPAPIPSAAPAAPPATPAPAAPPRAEPARATLATPAVRGVAKERGIDLRAVEGTGPEGRVTRADLDAHAAATPPGLPAPTAPAAPGAVERVPLRGVRRRMAEAMTRAARTAAPFTFVEEVDVTELEALKARAAPRAAEAGVKLTFLPFVVKAAVAALRRFPELNASFDEERGELLVKRWYDVGIATSTAQGLLVPVVRRADGRTLLDLARELERLAADARAGRVRPEDVGGSTFTVTSLGHLGGLLATPILNPPEVAILGVHRIRPTPVAREGRVVIRDVLHLSLTCDHRVVDGAAAAAFTLAVAAYLEDPALLFLESI